MQKKQKQNEVDVLEQIADEFARLLVLHVDEINSIKNLRKKHNDTKTTK